MHRREYCGAQECPSFLHIDSPSLLLSLWAPRYCACHSRPGSACGQSPSQLLCGCKEPWRRLSGLRQKLMTLTEGKIKQEQIKKMEVQSLAICVFNAVCIIE